MGVRAGFRLQASGLGLVIAWASGARADVDWAKGIVTAEGVGLADRHAPSPAVARGTSRRAAEDQARHVLAVEAGKLPLAGGGKVGDKLGADKLAQLAERAYAIAAEPETDGAWRVTMALPTEAVRQAIAGPRAADAAGDSAPAVVIVENAAAKPAIGWKIDKLEAATVWVETPPAWAKDAPRVRAKAVKAGAIDVDDTGRMTGGPATLYVILRNRP